MKATRIFIAVMASWMGLAGIEHGIGEIIQGNIAPAGLMILSWPNSPFFESLGGEPAMTVIPNLLLTGILAVVFSLVFIFWAIFCAHRRPGGFGLMLLAVPMLLFGGGIFPPFLGFLIGATALRLPAGPGGTHPGGLMRLVGRGWPWIFAACCTAWLALLPGVAVLDTFFGIQHDVVILGFMAAAIGLLPLAYIAAIQHDRLAWDENNAGR